MEGNTSKVAKLPTPSNSNPDPWEPRAASLKVRSYLEMFGPGFLVGKPPAVGQAQFRGVEPGPHTPNRRNYVFRHDLITDALLWLSGMLERNLWIAGPTRSGKSSFVQEIAAATGWEVFEFCGSKDKRDYDAVGGMELVQSGNAAVSEFMPGALLQAMLSPAGILLINEGDQLPEAFWTAMHDLLDNQKIYVPALKREVRASRHFRIAVTANSGGLGDVSKLYRGVQRVNIATLLRFSHMRIDYMREEDEIGWLLTEVPGLHETAARVIVRTAAEMRSAFVGSINVNAASTSQALPTSGDKLELVLGLQQCKNWAIRMLAYEQASWIKSANLDPMQEALMRTVLNICNDHSNLHQVEAVKQMLQSVRARTKVTTKAKQQASTQSGAQQAAPATP